MAFVRSDCCTTKELWLHITLDIMLSALVSVQYWCAAVLLCRECNAVLKRLIISLLLREFVYFFLNVDVTVFYLSCVCKLQFVHPLTYSSNCVVNYLIYWLQFVSHIYCLWYFLCACCMLYSVVVQYNLYMYEVCIIDKFCEEVFLCFSCLYF
jgi:hypothetical protein